MTRKILLPVACAAIMLLVSTQSAQAQVVYNAYGQPVLVTNPNTYYSPYVVPGAYYRPGVAAYGRVGVVGARYGAYGVRSAYGVRAGYRVGFRR
jgi:hypothetical protein